MPKEKREWDSTVLSQIRFRKDEMAHTLGSKDFASGMLSRWEFRSIPECVLRELFL